MINSVTNTANTAATQTTSKTTTEASPEAAQDRFLKLLVAQLNNQDPMNPLDNAQMTSQMAQINTVTGIQQLNDTVKGLVSQIAGQQLMQGSALVGRLVLTEGNTLAVDSSSGMGAGAFDLVGSAASVKVQVLDATNREVGTAEMGSLAAGRHNFTWDASKYAGDKAALRFKVVANNGEKSPVASTALSLDQVSSVSLNSGTVELELSRGGKVTQAGVKAIL